MSQAAERWDLSYTQNRELSWLAFDQRVLEEAADPSVPLMERLRFLSIFTSNLDEFFMVRVGSLTDLALVAPNARENKGGFSPAEQLRRIYAAVVPLVRQRDQVYRELIEALAEHGVADIPYKELKNGEREYVRAWYREAMRPLLMPQIIDPSHPFPHLKNKTLYAAALLRELSAIGNNVNQLAHQANARGEATRAEIRSASALVQEAWRLVREAV